MHRESGEVGSELVLLRPEPLTALPPECTGEKGTEIYCCDETAASPKSVHLILSSAPQCKFSLLHLKDVGTEPHVDFLGSHNQ